MGAKKCTKLIINNNKAWSRQKCKKFTYGVSLNDGLGSSIWMFADVLWSEFSVLFNSGFGKIFTGWTAEAWLFCALFFSIVSCLWPVLLGLVEKFDEVVDCWFWKNNRGGGGAGVEKEQVTVADDGAEIVEGRSETVVTEAARLFGVGGRKTRGPELDRGVIEIERGGAERGRRGAKIGTEVKEILISGDWTGKRGKQAKFIREVEGAAGVKAETEDFWELSSLSSCDKYVVISDAELICVAESLSLNSFSVFSMASTLIRLSCIWYSSWKKKFNQDVNHTKHWIP